jgi:hypothetical protein
MNNSTIRILAYAGSALIVLSILKRLNIQLDWTIFTGIPIIIPQAIDWIDTLVNKKDKSILEIEKKYQAKDKEQDDVLVQMKNIVYKTELTVNHTSKLQMLYDRTNQSHSEIAELKTSITHLTTKIEALEASKKKFESDFANWFNVTHADTGRKWRP